MVEALENWEKTPDGLVAMRPVIGSGAVITTGSVIVRWEFADDPAHWNEIAAGRKKPSFLQLGLTLAQLDETIRILQLKADRFRAMASRDGKPN